MGLNLGKIFGGIAKSVLPVAASFIPGPWGKIAGAVLPAMIGGQAQGQADQSLQQAAGGDQVLAGVQAQYYPQLYAALAQQSGLGQNGGMIPGFDPFGAMLTRYGDTASSAADHAVNLARMDLANRGFNGGDTLSQNVIGNIRQRTASDYAGKRIDTGVMASNEMYRRLLSTMSALRSPNSAAMLGVANAYQNQANAAGAAATTAAGTIADAINDLRKKKPGSGNTVTPGQTTEGPAPGPVGQPGWSDQSNAPTPVNNPNVA